MNFKKLNPFYWLSKFDHWLENKNPVLQIFLMLLMVFIVRTYVFGLYWVPTGSMEPTILVGEGYFADKLTLHFRPLKRGDIISFNAPFHYSENPFVKLFQKYIYGPENWTKRVIGLPGERIQGKIIDGKTAIFINGEKLDEPYVNRYPIVKIKESAWQLSFPVITWDENQKIIFKKSISYPHRVFHPDFLIKDEHQPFYNLSEEKLLPNDTNPEIFYPFTKYPYSSASDTFDITLGNDEYWGMGDNRLGSFDSRGFGAIKKEQIHGKIVLRLFSFNSPNSLLYDLIIVPISLCYDALKDSSNTFSEKCSTGINNIKHHFILLFRPWERWFCWMNN